MLYVCLKTRFYKSVHDAPIFPNLKNDLNEFASTSLSTLISGFFWHIILIQIVLLLGKSRSIIHVANLLLSFFHLFHRFSLSGVGLRLLHVAVL